MRNSIFFLCLLSLNILSAQTLSPKVLANAGQYREVGAIGISYTIGETLIQTNTTPSNIFTLGFNQSENVTNALVELGGQQLDIQYSPNPATDFISVQIKDNVIKDVSIALSDVEGRVIEVHPLSIGTQSVQFLAAQLANGVYFLQVLDGQKKVIQTYKVAIQH